MASPLSQTLIRTCHPSLSATKSPPPASRRVSRLLNFLKKLIEEDDVTSLATVHGRPSSPSPNFLTGKLGSLHFRIEKFMRSFGYTANIPYETHQALLCSQHMHLGIDGIKMYASKETCDFGHMRSTYDTRVERFAAHEGRMFIRFPAMALIVTNALMLSTPFVALAETCEADNSVFNMPALLFVALVGATVGGLLARQRKGELQRLNEQLRQINASLRRQAKIESYAPALSYAPVGGKIAEDKVIVDPRKEELISDLKSGKSFLRNQEPERAFVEFKAALDLAQILNDPIEEKKAARGLGASLQRQGKFREAIKYHSMVLEISKTEGEDSGNTEAYGAIADCYTELGDLEGAAKYYDNYIARLEKD